MEVKRYQALLKAWEDDGNVPEHLNEPDLELMRQCVMHLGRAVITLFPPDVHPRDAILLMLKTRRHYVQAKLIRWLCTNRTARQLVNPHGIVLQGALILGEWNKDGRVIFRGLDLAHADVPFPIEFRNCYLPGGIRLTSARTRTIILRHCDVGAILAAGVHVDGSLLLDQAERDRNDSEDSAEDRPVTRVFGGMTIYGATITRDLSCRRAIVYSRTAGDRNPGFRIPDDLGGHRLEYFLSPSLEPWMALNADDVSVGSVYLRFGFQAYGSVRFKTARIRGDLHCENGLFVNTDGWSFNARGSTVGGDVRLCCRSAFMGGIDLSVADVHGNMYIGEIQVWYAFASPRLAGATGESLSENCAIFADGLRVQGNLDFRRPPSFVSVYGDQIGPWPSIPADLPDAGKLLEDLNQKCLSLLEENISELLPADCQVIARTWTKVKPSARVIGTISLIGAHVRGTLDCLGLWVVHPQNSEYALRLSRAVINGVLFLNSRFEDSASIAPFAAVGSVELTFCRAKSLFDCAVSWPAEGRLLLEGFRYDDIAEDSIHGSGRGAERPGEVVSRVAWLARQAVPISGAHDPQPYEQAARVLRRSGHELAWRELAARSRQREMADRRGLLWRHVRHGQTATHEPSPVLDRVGSLVRLAMLHVSRPVLWIAGYGYTAARAAVFWIALVILGSLVFGRFDPVADHSFVPAQSVMYAYSPWWASRAWKRDYPAFDNLLYSLDCALPVINLHQEAFWVPSPHGSTRGVYALGIHTTWGEVCEYYLAFHIMTGWLMFTITLITLTKSLWKESEELEE